MAALKENLENIRTKLIEHIKSTYDETKAQEYITNLNSMDEEQFIAFLKEQGLLGKDGEKKQQCIFCSIVFGDIPSTKIAENEKAIAILDINPASLGHTLIIPKEHIEKRENMPGEAGKLALFVQEKLQKAFSPNRVDMIATNVMGHELINLLPIYKEETLDSPRKKLEVEELQKLKEKIDSSSSENQKEGSTETSKESPKEEINENNTWLSKRLP